jgi:hypothetical protein
MLSTGMKETYFSEMRDHGEFEVEINEVEYTVKSYINCVEGARTILVTMEAGEDKFIVFKSNDINKTFDFLNGL